MLKFNSVLLLTLITCLATAAHGDLIAHFPLDSDGDSKDGLFVAALNENVTYGESGANANTGTSALFNGSTSRIQHPWNESLNPTNFSVTVWALSNAGAGSWNSPVTSRNDLNPDSEGFLIYDSQPSGSWTFWSGNGTDDGNWQTLDGPAVNLGEWEHIAITYDDEIQQKSLYVNGVLEVTQDTAVAPNTVKPFNIGVGHDLGNNYWFEGYIDDIGLWDEVLSESAIQDVMDNGIKPPPPLLLVGDGQTYLQNFDEMATDRSLPQGWNGVTNAGTRRGAAGLGLTDGFLTVPGSVDDGVLGVLNLGGNADSFGPATDGLIPTWTAELGGDSNIFGRDDVIADNASDRALGVSRENNDHVGELNFEIEIADANLRAFVLDWDLEIWGGDPDSAYRSEEGPGMKVDVTVGGTSYDTVTRNLLPGASFDSLEDGGDTNHNATLIDGNVHSIRGITSGIKEVSDVDGAIGNMVQLNFNSNWNGAADGDANGWFSAIDNVQLRALAPGDADANGVVNVDDLLQLLGGQKFNAGVDAVTWEQGDFNADDQFDTSDLLAMLSFLSGTFPSDPYASEAGGANDAVADIIVNSETGEVTVDLAGHTVSAVIIESASEIFNGSQPEWDTTSQFPSTLPGELGNVLFTSTAAGTDELGVVISAEFLGRDKEFYLQDLDLNILIASEGGALTKGNVIVVPEPSTWMLLGLGSLAIVGVVRRRVV